MKKILFAFIVIVGFSCKEESPLSVPDVSLLSQERIDDLVHSIEPAFTTLRRIKTGKHDLTAVSYELVVDRATGEMTLLNFQSEDFFVFFEEDASAKTAGDKYIVECHNNGKVTKTECSTPVGCGKAIKDCLNSGGCASVCEAPKPYATIHAGDVAFFETYGVKGTALQAIQDLPKLDLQKARSNNTLSSIKLYTVLD